MTGQLGRLLHFTSRGWCWVGRDGLASLGACLVIDCSLFLPLADKLKFALLYFIIRCIVSRLTCATPSYVGGFETFRIRAR